ncbi:MAG: P-II family nitrogen regulator [Vicinamibacteria bacterium]|jgi:nitrogen regulatory protein P-II 1|nr:P-II family nitrogen regulator [Vicinamibacteria bacterium]
MRQITAFVRCVAADPVVRALEATGVRGMAVSWVRGLGYGFEPEHIGLGPRDVSHASEMARIDVVCSAVAVDHLVQVLADSARSGLAGDGLVVVTPVERAVRVLTGQEGPEALATLGSSEPRSS